MTAYKGLGTYGNAAGVVTPLDHKLSNAAMVVKQSGNLIRPGLFWGGNATIITGKANMSYDVAAYSCVTTRGATSGAVFGGNDGVLNVPTTAAPGSNSRYDVIYHWHREYSLDGVDSNPVIGVIQGTAAASPTVPSLAAFPGAIEIARVLVPAGVTATNTGTTITQTAPFTAMSGGAVPFRTKSELDLWTTATPNQHSFVTADGSEYVWLGVAWVPLTAADRVLLSRNSNTFNIPSGISTQLTNTPLDTTKAVGATASGGAITIATAGDYWVSAKVMFTANATGIRQLYVNKNSTTSTTNVILFDEAPGNSAAATSVQGRRLLTLAAGDVLRLFVAQNAGVDVSLLAGATQIPGIFFEVVKA